MEDPACLRKNIIAATFPDGVPRLWCPLLTHYHDDGTIDFERMTRHLEAIVPAVEGFLIPGSTGDGWELDDTQTLDVARFAVRQAQKLGCRLLLGVLKRDTTAMIRTISALLGAEAAGQSKEDTLRILREKHIVGFTVCPPAGKDLTQSQIMAALGEILEMGLPTALYQLPQVTGNEVAPETFAGLARRYANLIFFKDSSGQDRIARSGADGGGIFMVRGAEGDYVDWLKIAAGPYDGFLLSTANVFARELKALIAGLERGDRAAAAAISRRLTAAINEIFALVRTLPYGNPFTNANKACDHFFAFGTAAERRPPPLLRSGVRLPGGVMAATQDILRRYLLLPEKGYLEG